MDSLYTLRATPYGGRGLFSTHHILKDTLLHICPSPYASVIYRVFRKEVCAECFAYSFEANRNAWNITSEAGNGVWFCRESCRELWTSHRDAGGLLGQMNCKIDKLAQSMKKSWTDRAEVLLPTISPGEISLESLDMAWKNAEKRDVLLGRSDNVKLDDMELDTARFVVSAIIKRYIEDNGPSDAASNVTSGWSEFLQLQDNELLHVRSRPYTLDSHLRIYAFLRKALLPVLQVYVVTSETVRAILSRDQGNAFGMWDMSTADDGEMLGWGMYVSGSYFNHNCAPNVRKERVGRALHFYTTKDVEQGEELCINYIDVQDVVGDRRGQLHDSWYFDCACKRCEQELAAPA